MNTYLVTFLSVDGNKQQVYVDGFNEYYAEKEFMRCYQYSEIFKIEFVQ